MKTKACTECGATFHRNVKYSNAQWEAQTKCTIRCAMQARIKADNFKRIELSERFWSQVQKGSPEDCWPWLGSKDNHGYGQIQVRSESGRWRPTKAHRVAWFLETGKWPKPCGLHRCDNPPCVNFGHLFEGTTQDNTADMMRKGRHNPVPRKAFCKRGHPLSGTNLIVAHLRTRNNKIARSCRACKSLSNRRSA